MSIPKADFLKQTCFAPVIAEMHQIYLDECVEQLHKGEAVSLYYKTCRIRCPIEQLTMGSQEFLKQKLVEVYSVSAESDGWKIAQQIKEAWKNSDISKGASLDGMPLFDPGAGLMSGSSDSPLGMQFKIVSQELAEQLKKIRGT